MFVSILLAVSFAAALLLTISTNLPVNHTSAI